MTDGLNLINYILISNHQNGCGIRINHLKCEMGWADSNELMA